MLCHPVKNAAKDNLLPRGGGQFLNELDANLTLWGGAGQIETTVLHWHVEKRSGYGTISPLMAGAVRSRSAIAISSSFRWTAARRWTTRPSSAGPRLMRPNWRSGSAPTAHKQRLGRVAP